MQDDDNAPPPAEAAVPAPALDASFDTATADPHLHPRHRAVRSAVEGHPSRRLPQLQLHDRPAARRRRRRGLRRRHAAADRPGAATPATSILGTAAVAPTRYR